MSDPVVTEWDAVVADVQSFVKAVAPLIPVISAAIPAVGPGIALGLQIVQGALAASPVAQELYTQIVSGKPPTPAQLSAFQDSYEADDDKLKNDIAAQLAKLQS